MRRKSILVVMGVLLSVINVGSADIFGTGANQFTIDFVNISGDASSANGTNISQWPLGHSSCKTFTDPGNYRIGIYEITNDQWNKFQASYGTVTGSEGYGGYYGFNSAYNESPVYTGTNVPTNELSWYEAAQFVNYLNTSTGHQAAYKFTGTQGTSDYTFSAWESGDEGYDADNRYRNSNANYFLPTEGEWIKAGYWNGTSLQTYTTKAGESLTQGDGTTGTGWNYWDWARPISPWDVGSGSEELNGTFDMMGNLSEWMETPFYSGVYLYNVHRGGGFEAYEYHLTSSIWYFDPSGYEHVGTGFRVASVPEPVPVPSAFLLGAIGLGYAGRKLRRRREFWGHHTHFAGFR